ncbi:MAG: hypothetical protein U0229_13140 [Anaeromyxobacter sp.]
MRGFVARAVERLRSDPGFSRNRFFLALSSPEGKEALRIHRHLRSIERDLARGWSVTAAREEGRVRVELTGAKSRRTSYLTGAEFRLLCQSPEVRAALGEELVAAIGG